MFLYWQQYHGLKEGTSVKRLYRSETDKKLAGICGGIGEYMDADPTIVRLIIIVLAVVTGIIPMIIAYLIAWWIVPNGKEVSSNVS